jgi:hypothetical protein
VSAQSLVFIFFKYFKPIILDITGQFIHNLNEIHF